MTFAPLSRNCSTLGESATGDDRQRCQFGREPCGEDKQDTKDLKSAIAEVLKTTPLVMGEGGDILGTLVCPVRERRNCAVLVFRKLIFFSRNRLPFQKA